MCSFVLSIFFWVNGTCYHGNQVSVQSWTMLAVMAASLKETYGPKLEARSEVAQNGHCRLWTGTIQSGKNSTYGVLNCRVSPKTWRRFYVHRLALVFAKNLAPEDIEVIAGEDRMSVSHLCHNSLCINGHHLAYEPQALNRARCTCLAQGVCSGHRGWPNCMLHLNINCKV